MMNREKYRTGLKRFWASIVDSIIFTPLMYLDYSIVSNTNSMSMLFAWSVFMSFAPILYSVILHYKTGQTVGKMLTGVKVLDISERKRLTLKQAVYRDSFYLLAATSFALYRGLQMAAGGDSGPLINDAGFFDNLYFFWTLVELISMLTNRKRRAVHDFLAGSVVIRTEYSVERSENTRTVNKIHAGV
jgi:uncharacterized RDD family membrane protein YckC